MTTIKGMCVIHYLDICKNLGKAKNQIRRMQSRQQQKSSPQSVSMLQ